MNRYYYDLHLHSALSPCADDDNTPNNIAGMASLCGLNIIALTDHNSTKNCPAFFEAAKKYGLIPVAGMELTTAEDIHLVCLFEELSDAMSFGEFVDGRRFPIRNRPDVFGEQYIFDGMDNVIGTEEYFLSNATDLSLECAADEVIRHGGICYPAHIDRMSNGIIATLGAMPKAPHFSAVEFHNAERISEYTEKYGLTDKTVIISSDSHCLTDMRDKENYFELADEPYSSQTVRRELFRLLRGAGKEVKNEGVIS